MTSAFLRSTSNASQYRWLAFAASLATFALIVVGGLVRVAGAGLGCGADWLLCQGQWFPALDFNTALQLWHRALSLIAGGLVLGLAVGAWRNYRRVRWIVGPALIAVALLVIQMGLGALTAQQAFPPGGVALHYAAALGRLAMCLIVTTTAFQLARDPRLGEALLRFDPLSRLVSVTMLSVFGLLVLGALVTAFGASNACLGWPLCSGALIPASPLGWLNMIHRYAAGGVGLLLIGAVTQAWQLRRHNTPVAVTAALVATLFISQIIVSAQNALLGFSIVLNGLHLALATAVWAGMVVFAVLAFQYVRLSPLKFTAPTMLRDLKLAPGYVAAFGRAFGDYVALTKPIIMVLLLATTLAAMVVAGHGWPPVDLLLWTALGGALASGGASALNQVIDRELDQHMARTSRRPLASGRVDVAGGLAFGLALSILSFVLLAAFVNLLTAFLALAGNLYYVLGYSVFLKKSSVQNIVIGGGAGAIPPLVGWAAVTGRLDFNALFLFAIIFFWTPPHFWALALLKKNDYARAQIPMLPVIWGEAETRWHIFLYTLLMVALTLLLTPAQVAGMFYLVTAAILGAGFLYYAVRLLRGGSNKVAWGLYKYSSLYLALIFLALVADRFIG